MAVEAPIRTPHETSLARAWWQLVRLSVWQQARMREMIWIALALLILSGTLLAVNVARGRTTMSHWRWFWSRYPAPPRMGFLQPKNKEKDTTSQTVVLGPDGRPPGVLSTYHETVTALDWVRLSLPWQQPASLLQLRAADAWGRALGETGFYVYSNWFVFPVFVGFLLPVWSLSFATEALGGEREGQSLVWLLTRPMPKPLIYLGKFVGILPWSLSFSLIGFFLLCLVSGKRGMLAFSLFWPAVLGGCLAFSSLFHFLAIVVRRAAVVGLVYSFFLETLFGMMPGYMKRLTLGFYIKCAMFDAAGEYSIHPEKPSVYMPVDGITAWAALASVTVFFLVLGTYVFSRTEYHDVA